MREMQVNPTVDLHLFFLPKYDLKATLADEILINNF